MVRMTMGLLLLGLALVGCGLDLSLRPPYSVGPTDKPFGFKVEGQEIVIAATPLRVYVQPGALGGRLVGYEVIYLASDNGEAIPGDPGGSGDLAVPIPPGCVVDEHPCPKDKFGPRTSEPFRGVVLDGPVASAMVRAWEGGGSVLNWRMRIRWKAEDDNRVTHSWVQEYRIQFPVE
ncbi:MAG: hypothetical protein ACUVUP_06255 [Thermaceae bacterium]